MIAERLNITDEKQNELLNQVANHVSVIKYPGLDSTLVKAARYLGSSIPVEERSYSNRTRLMEKLDPLLATSDSKQTGMKKLRGQGRFLPTNPVQSA